MSQIDWKAWIGRQHWQGGKVTAFIGKRWGGRAGGEKAENFYLNWLTVFGNLDLGALMLPNDGGGR